MMNFCRGSRHCLVVFKALVTQCSTRIRKVRSAVHFLLFFIKIFLSWKLMERCFVVCRSESMSRDSRARRYFFKLSFRTFYFLALL